jgi:radical SAM superfamily enzyme YgiQ (UPF0313 family)
VSSAAPDVLLVNPYVIRRHAARMASFRPYPPLGLMYLGAVLRAHGYTVEIYDATFEDGPERVAERLQRGPRPRVAGVYAMNSFRDDALAAVKHLKEQGLVVLAGGPDPSIYDADYLSAGVDVVVRGEGEVAILEVLDAYGIRPSSGSAAVHPLLRGSREAVLRSIPGVSFFDSVAELHRSADRPGTKSMDQLPSPAYDLIDLGRYLEEWKRTHGHTSLQFMTSRGCPFSCTWCARPIFGRRYRQYGPERAVDEIAFLVERYGVEHLWLFDDTFVVRREWVEAFCAAIVRRGIRVSWECLARTDLVDRALLELMRNAGCTRINFGFESGSQRVLDAMKKGTHVADARRVAQDMHQLGITMGGYVLFGYPGEEWPDIEATVQLVKDLAPVDYSTSVAHPMPGTEFYDRVAGLMLSEDWASAAEEGVHWRAPYSPGFYRLVESLLHAEYDLALEFSVARALKARLLRAALFALRTAGDGGERLEEFRSEHWKGWQGLRRPEQSARHRQGHRQKAERLRASPDPAPAPSAEAVAGPRLRVVS